MINWLLLFLFQGLYSWRDQVARIEDESIGYVLPNHLLLKLGTSILVIIRNIPMPFEEVAYKNIVETPSPSCYS